MDPEIVIKPNYNTEVIFNVSLLVSFRKISVKFLVITNAIIIALLLVNIILGTENSVLDIIKPYFVFLLLWPVALVVYIFLLSRKAAKNPKIKEQIIGTYTADFFEEKGETFSVKFFWKDMQEIAETKKYFLIMVSSTIVKFIKKSDLKDNQYNELKALFNSINIKKSLK